MSRAKKIARRRLKKMKKQITPVPACVLESTLEATEPKDFLFSWPIRRDSYYISCRFGPRNMRGVGWKFHTGLDMAACKGTPVMAAAAGIVIASEWQNGYGNCIMIAHNKKYKTRYAHLNRRFVKVGQKVARGAVIGEVGDTGFVRSKRGRAGDASHLHFEVLSFGKYINPLFMLT